MEDQDPKNREELARKTEELVNQALRGDKDAIAALYQLYEDKLMSEVRDKLGPKLRSQLDSVDLLQSVWKDALDDMRGFEYQGPESFFRWLVTCLVHKIQTKGRYFAADKRNPRKVNRIRNEDSQSDAGVLLPPSSDPTPSELAIDKERLDDLRKILDTFPELQRRVLIYRLRDELDYEEIGKRIDKSTEATRMLYGRSLKKLIDLMLDDRGPAGRSERAG
jgi:RNA polymerase sigma factor (sigma-70 family)